MLADVLLKNFVAAADVLLKNFVAAADVLLKNFVAAAVFSVSYFSMLLTNFVAAYKSLKEACAISGPCTSTRTWSAFHCSPYLSQLTRAGRKRNEARSVTWRLLSQITRSSLKTDELSRCCTRWSLSPFSCEKNSAVVVSNKVKPAVGLHKNATIFSVRSATRNLCQALVTAYRNCKAMRVSICTACFENSLQCSSSFKKGVGLKESLNRSRKRDREPSRIPVKRILNVFRKKKNRKKVHLFVRQTIPTSSLVHLFITCLSQNYKTWQLRYNSNNFYSKYAFNMRIQQSTTRQKHCRCMPNAQSIENHFHC